VVAEFAWGMLLICQQWSFFKTHGITGGGFCMGYVANLPTMVVFQDTWNYWWGVLLNFLSEENFEIRVVKIIVPIFQNHRYSYALHWFKVL
jgi:hypothetical protein